MINGTITIGLHECGHLARTIKIKVLNGELSKTGIVSSWAYNRFSMNRRDIDSLKEYLSSEKNNIVCMYFDDGTGNVYDYKNWRKLNHMTHYCSPIVSSQKAAFKDTDDKIKNCYSREVIS